MIADTMAEEEIINIGVVDVDFAVNLGEGDEALVAVVCHVLGEMPRCFRASSDSSQSQLELPLWFFSTISVSRSSFSCSDCHSSWGIRSMRGGCVLVE